MRGSLYVSTSRLIGLLGIGLAAMVAGCAHLDTTPPASAERVLTGIVSNGTNAPLPSNSEVTVRIVDLSRGEGRGEVLGEQTILNPGSMPVMFRIEYVAEDAVLRRSVNVEARVSVGGRLRYTTTTAHPVTMGNLSETHVLDVVLAQKP